MHGLFLLFFALLTQPVLAEPSSRDIELALANSLRAIRESRLDAALNEIETLTRTNPNFRLAQLIKGDLLMAHARPISDFGAIPDAPQDRIEELREEANVRLQRVQHPAPTGVPKYLWQLSPEQRYAVVVDTGQSTLYLYENTGGEPRYVADFYISIGKNGAGKSRKGDQKTPLGVYFINGYLPGHTLNDFYGIGAWPLDYPNAWDRRLGRNGDGIWLHGTPSDTYSRPPKASNGCIVLANDDLSLLGKYLRVGHTPIIITPKMDWLSEGDRADREALLQAIEQWRTDWSNRDTARYLAHYASDFSTGSMDFAAFAEHKRRVNRQKQWIRVSLSNLSIFHHPGEPDMAVVSFDQDYASDNLSNRMHKRQYWIKRDGRWQILYEGAA